MRLGAAPQVPGVSKTRWRSSAPRYYLSPIAKSTAFFDTGVRHDFGSCPVASSAHEGVRLAPLVPYTRILAHTGGLTAAPHAACGLDAGLCSGASKFLTHTLLRRGHNLPYPPSGEELLGEG